MMTTKMSTSNHLRMNWKSSCTAIPWSDTSRFSNQNAIIACDTSFLSLLSLVLWWFIWCWFSPVFVSELKFLLLELRVLNTGSCPEIKWRSPLWPLPHPGPVRAEGSGLPYQSDAHPWERVCFRIGRVELTLLSRDTLSEICSFTISAADAVSTVEKATKSTNSLDNISPTKR